MDITYGVVIVVAVLSIAGFVLVVWLLGPRKPLPRGKRQPHETVDDAIVALEHRGKTPWCGNS